jgi:hypothetical protein
MSRYGIIYCCYGNPEYIEDCLKPWLEAKKQFNIKIAAVHGQFKEYHDFGIDDRDIDTQKELLNRLEKKDLDFLYIQNEYNNEKIYQTESEIRDKGLQWLLKQDCDFIFLLDNDEFYTIQQIENIINYINRGDNSFINWFSIPFKNYIFDGKSYTKGFTPPRIFRVKPYGDLALKLDSFYWDNDIRFKIGDKFLDYKKLANLNIPENLLGGGIKHLTWLHSNGKGKVEYQLKHFGHCSYKWNNIENKLEFDPDFYKKYNIPLSVVYKDI